MKTHAADDRPTRLMAQDYFTGTVLLDPLIEEAPAPARLRLLRVTFLPGARTHWHSHPLGQALHVVSGTCLVQREGGPVERLAPGGTVWIEPGEKHWHGATPEQAMVHIAAHESLDGHVVDWMEPVTDAEYGSA